MTHDDIEDVFDGYERAPEPALHTPSWRRPVLIAVAAITAFAMALVPLYNVIDRSPPIADNGLEVCGWDYCIIQDAARRAGIEETMSRLANTFLADQGAADLTETLLAQIGAPNVRLAIADRIAGSSAGRYDPMARVITVERPVRAWTIVHEVAHVRGPGHGSQFQERLIMLARWLDRSERA